MDNSPLGRLSPELRNHIYAQVFSSPRDVSLLAQQYEGKIQHSITKVCRQLRTETLLMDYANTDFKDFWAGNANCDKTCAWLRRLGPHGCSAMRSLGGMFISEKQSGKATSEGPILTLLRNQDERLPNLGPWRPYVRNIANTLQKMGVGLRATDRTGGQDRRPLFVMTLAE